MDIENMIAAKIGETTVARIYRGENKIWDGYLWQKWDTKIVTETLPAVSRFELNVTFYADAPLLPGEKAYMTISHVPDVVFFQLAYPAKTYGDAFEHRRFPFVSQGNMVFPGSCYYHLDSISGDRISASLYSVHSGGTAQKTGKGDNLLETVEGFSGSFPTNGLHSDGFWYVKI